MPKYSEFQYGRGELYGQASRVAFSAEPVTAVAVSHSKIRVNWTSPLSTDEVDYVGFRVVRNQDAFPETEEDGVIIYEIYGGLVDTIEFEDGADETAGFVEAPLVSGRFTYYRTWILLAGDGDWAPAGDAYTLLPSPHASGTGPVTVGSEWSSEYDEVGDVTLGNQNLTTTHDRMMGLIPRVYLSKNQGPMDAIQDYNALVDASGGTDNSLLNQFLKGFSLTADEFLNYADFIAPDVSGRNTEPNILALQSHQLNLTFDTAGISRTQKKMVREAMYTYRRKGTMNGLQTAVESITGYDVNLIASRNLLLSPQDSTFYKGIGFWQADSGATITASNRFTTPNFEDVGSGAIDSTWSGKVVTSATNRKVYNGYTSPITRGVPVVAGQEYALSFWANFTDDPGVGTATAVPSIRWFDRKGQVLETVTAETGFDDAEGNWVRATYTQTAPENAVYAGISVTLSVVGTWYLDMFKFEQVDEALGQTFDFEEARGVKVFLLPKKTNYIEDPSFEGDLSSWTFDNGTETAVNITVGGVYDGPIGARSGAKKLNFVSEATGDCTISTEIGAPLPFDRFYTFSFYAKADEDVTATITLLDSNEEETSKEIALTDAWQRFFVTHYYKKPTYFSQLTATILGTDWAGATIEIDCAQLEESYYPTDYFDGSLTLSGGAWMEPSPNASRSCFYPARNTRLTRLANEIEKYLPINTPYQVQMFQNDGDNLVTPRGIS
jgi:hypothetical protein